MTANGLFRSCKVQILLFPGAIEKQKLVYILNRDAQARLTISSPLEAHKSNTLVYHMVGVDVGFENPTFACLEIDYEVRKLPANRHVTCTPKEHCAQWNFQVPLYFSADHADNTGTGA